VSRTLADPELDDVEVLFCDGDGNLYPSEEPAFEASCEVTNELMESVGSSRRFEPLELRLATTGKNFRTTAVDLVAGTGAEPLRPDELERWVREELERVTEHLAMMLRPDPEVSGPLRRLTHRYELALVTSSAAVRADACLTATHLNALFPVDLRFSAENSLPVPLSKPDPAIYDFALANSGVEPAQAVAIEDSRPGVEAAIGAGIATVGNLVFVPAAEREDRARDLREAGAFFVVETWEELADMLERAGRRSRPVGVGR